MSINEEHLKDFPIKNDVATTGTYGDYIWIVAKAPAYGYNGYVRIPDDEIGNHPWAVNNDYIFEPEGSDLCWSEVTYDCGNWFGFDTLHSFNYWPTEYIWADNKKPFIKTIAMMRDEHSITMSLERVENMTRGFAKQASDAYLHVVAAGTHQI